MEYDDCIVDPAFSLASPFISPLKEVQESVESVAVDDTYGWMMVALIGVILGFLYYGYYKMAQKSAFNKMGLAQKSAFNKMGLAQNKQNNIGFCTMNETEPDSS